MTREQIFDKVSILTLDHLRATAGDPDQPITEATTLAGDLELDSLDIIELVIAVEDGLSTPTRAVEITDAENDAMVTIGDLVDIVARQILPASGQAVA